MASPTFAETMTQLANYIHLIEEHNKFLRTNSDNFAGMEDTLIQSLESDFASEILSYVSSLRSSHSNLISQGAGALSPLLQTIAKAISSNRSDVQGIIDDLRDYMIANSQSINRRELTLGGEVVPMTDGAEVLDEVDFATHATWDVTGDGDDTGGNFTHTHSAGSSTLTQTNANLASTPTANKWYEFTYTISSPSGDATLTIDAGFAREAQTLSTTAGTHTLYFLSSDGAATDDFVISGASASGAITIDDVTLKEAGMTGNGEIYRCSTDADGEPMENVPATTAGLTWELECVNDENSGTSPGAEIFTVRYQDGFKDELDFDAPAFEVSVAVKNPDNGLGLENPSFADLDGTVGAPTTIPGWTWDGTVSTDLNLDSTNYYVTSPVEADAGTSYSLDITTNGNLTQTLDNSGISLDPNTPYLCLIAYNRSVNSGDGTLTLHMGSQSASATLSSAPDGWNILAVPSTPGQNSWLENFNEASLDIKIQLASRTTGSVLVDHLIFAPFDQFANHYFAIVQGRTNFQVNDIFTLSDSVTTEAILQFWMWRLTGRYLPSATGAAETVSDP